jgi:hypothetical protein
MTYFLHPTPLSVEANLWIGLRDHTRSPVARCSQMRPLSYFFRLCTGNVFGTTSGIPRTTFLPYVLRRPLTETATNVELLVFEFICHILEH